MLNWPCVSRHHFSAPARKRSASSDTPSRPPLDSPPRGQAFSCRTLGLLVELLDSRLKTPPGSDEVAAYVGLSPSHFATKFRRTTGLNLGRFLNVRRIQASFDVLRSSSHPLASLAVDLGFASQSHFTRVFHDHTGMTPARYRKRLAAPAA